MAGFPAASARSNRSRSVAARRRPPARPRWDRSAISSRFSSPVSRLSTAENCPVTPMTLRTAPGSRPRSWPATVTTPASAGRIVDRIHTVVVFPEPFGTDQGEDGPLGDGEVEAV